LPNNVHLHTYQTVVASAIVLVCASALAETPEALVKQALQRNPELNFFVAEIAAAKGAVRTAETVRNPELSSEVGYKNSRTTQEERAAMARSWLSHSAKPSSIPVDLRYARQLQITI
jgi:outer membrane protein TolC